MKGSRYHSHDDSTGLLFWQVSTLWQRAVKDALRPFNLTHTQYVILAVIAELNETDGDITQKMISDFSMIDPMTTSSTLRLLEKKGLAQRNPSKSDSRANTICTTGSGLELLGKAVRAVETVDAAFFFKEESALKSFQELLRELKMEHGGQALRG